MQEGDCERIRRAAHNLKGSSANVGAARLAEALSELEHRSHNDDTVGARELLAEIEAEFHVACAALSRECEAA